MVGSRTAAAPHGPETASAACRLAMLAALGVLAVACSSSNGSGGAGTGASSAAGGSKTTGTGGSKASSSGGTGTGGAGTGAVHTGGSCSGSTTRPADPPITVDLQGRTYDIFLPPGVEAADGGVPDGGAEDGGGPGDGGSLITTPVPLFLELHGFAGSPSDKTPWFDEEMANQFIPEAQKRGIITVLPHGNFDPIVGRFFWNATDACCDLEQQMPNDVGYLMAVIQDAESRYDIDPKRIFAFGHSNGGFMINRLACDQADKIAAVVSLAGETYKDQCKCAASAPIGYLQVQGDADMTVPYPGGSPEGIMTLPIAPGAIETTQDWAKKNLCSPKADTSQPMIQLMTTSNGPDTTKLVYDSGCQGNGETELWTIHLGPHSPPFNSAWASAVFDWLMAHPKP